MVALTLHSVGAGCHASEHGDAILRVCEEEYWTMNESRWLHMQLKAWQGNPWYRRCRAAKRERWAPY